MTDILDLILLYLKEKGYHAWRGWRQAKNDGNFIRIDIIGFFVHIHISQKEIKNSVNVFSFPDMEMYHLNYQDPKFFGKLEETISLLIEQG